MKIFTKRWHRRGGVAMLAATLIASAAGLVTASPASAEELILVDYQVNGTTHIQSTDSDIALGPAVLHAGVASDGSFTGDMALPGARTEFSVLGFLPVTADVYFEPVEPTTGKINVVNVRYRALTTTSKYHVRLRNLKVAGFPLFAGPFCRTINPVVINANTPAGEYFNIGRGGRVQGEFTLGNFQHCGLNTWLVNSIVPGSGNTIDLTLSDAVFVN